MKISNILLAASAVIATPAVAQTSPSSEDTAIATTSVASPNATGGNATIGQSATVNANGGSGANSNTSISSVSNTHIMSPTERAAYKVYRKNNPENYKLSCREEGGSISIIVKGKTTSIETSDRWGDKEKISTTLTVFYNVADAKAVAYSQCKMGFFGHDVNYGGIMKAVDSAQVFYGEIRAIDKDRDMTADVKLMLQPL